MTKIRDNCNALNATVCPIPRHSHNYNKKNTNKNKKWNKETQKNYYTKTQTKREIHKTRIQSQTKIGDNCNALNATVCPRSESTQTDICHKTKWIRELQAFLLLPNWQIARKWPLTNNGSPFFHIRNWNKKIKHRDIISGVPIEQEQRSKNILNTYSISSDFKASFVGFSK